MEEKVLGGLHPVSGQVLGEGMKKKGKKRRKKVGGESSLNTEPLTSAITHFFPYQNLEKG